MFLYELAMSLDQRSPDLVDAAAELGMGELQPASELSPEQVAALRAHFGDHRPAPLAPLGGGPPPLPAVQVGPLVAEPGADPFGAGRPQQPSAPASWGPPVAPTPPPSWGPPTAGAPAAGAAAAGATAGFDPQDPNHQGPYFAYPDGPTAEVVDDPSGLENVTLPPAPPPPPKPKVAPDGSTPTGPGGLGRGQLVALGVVGLLVVGLFGFMIANTGPDKGKEQELAAKERELEADLERTTIAPTTTTTEPQATTTDEPAQDAYSVVDKDKFCAGGVAVATFELRLMAAMADQDFAELSSLVRDRRAGWERDVEVLKAGAPPIYVNDIEMYAAADIKFFDAVASSSSLAEASSKVDRVEMVKAANAAEEFQKQVQFECQ